MYGLNTQKSLFIKSIYQINNKNSFAKLLYALIYQNIILKINIYLHIFTETFKFMTNAIQLSLSMPCWLSILSFLIGTPAHDLPMQKTEMQNLTYFCIWKGVVKFI